MTDRIVDPHRTGAYGIIGHALAAAEPGDRILIRPGLYEECLEVDKSVAIIGQGHRRDIVIKAIGKPVLRFAAASGRIAHLTLCQSGDSNARIGVVVEAGQILLEDCDVASACALCILIFSEARGVVRRNRIHGSSDAGVVLVDTSSCIVASNDIFDHARAGVSVIGGKPTLRHNRVYNNHGFGILHLDGRSLLEGNHICANRYAGVHILSGMSELRGNHIARGAESGLFVDHNGRAILEDNRIVFNGQFGVDVGGTSYVTLRHNKIAKNGWQAVAFSAGSNGTLEDNDLLGTDDDVANGTMGCRECARLFHTRAMHRQHGRSGVRRAQGRGSCEVRMPWAVGSSRLQGTCTKRITMYCGRGQGRVRRRCSSKRIRRDRDVHRPTSARRRHRQNLL